MEETEMTKDYMIRATVRRKETDQPELRAFAITGRDLVEEARSNHQTSPVVTAALGRLLCGGIMMGSMLKEEDDLLTLRISGDGPIMGLTVTANKNGQAKGYPVVPRVEMPLRADGHLNVGAAIGKGTLTVIRDMGLKDPYVGTIELRSSEVAEDLTYYYAVSEQIPSTIGLGVLVAGDESVLQAGGFCIQLLPFASEECIEQLEKNVKQAPSVTQMLRDGLTPEDMLTRLVEGFTIENVETIPASFSCNCSRERVEHALALIDKKELAQIIADGKEEEVKCRFCNRAYRFSPEEMKTFL